MYRLTLHRATLLSDRNKRRGLTLLELLVVLTILAALAGIVVPLFPNFLRRAHKAVDATQTSEISKAVQTYQASFLSYPDNFDLLTDGTSTTFPSYLPAETAGTPFGGFVTNGTLTTNEVKALGQVGITRVQPLLISKPAATSSTFHPTLNPYSTANGVTTTLTDTTPVAILDKNAVETANPSFLAAERVNDPTARFVVFGVGNRTSMIGQTIQDAPMSAPQKKQFTPDNTYSRVGVIFKVSGVEVERSERARFIAAVALEDDELESTEKDVVGYYGASVADAQGGS